MITELDTFINLTDQVEAKNRKILKAWCRGQVGHAITDANAVRGVVKTMAFQIDALIERLEREQRAGAKLRAVKK